MSSFVKGFLCGVGSLAVLGMAILYGFGWVLGSQG